MRLFSLSQNVLFTATSRIQPDPGTPSVQTQQRPATAFSTTSPSTIPASTATPIPTPTPTPTTLEPRYIPTPPNPSSSTHPPSTTSSTAPPYFLTFTDLTYGTLPRPLPAPTQHHHHHNNRDGHRQPDSSSTSLLARPRGRLRSVSRRRRCRCGRRVPHNSKVEEDAVANVGGELTQSTTSGGDGNVATVTPTVTVLELGMASVVPKGTATWAGG